MPSPAAAIAWEFRQRHRWGLSAIVLYLLVLAALQLALRARGQIVTFDDSVTVAFVVVVPLTTTFLYFMAMFSYGLDGDLAARQSMYPARMFTRPVSTAALAGWPIVYGAAAMSILWATSRMFAVWPSGLHIPVVWPGLLAASLLAWLQAMTWMPYPLRGLRVIAIVLWLTTIDAVVFIALEYKVPESVMLAILAPHIPLASLAARFAVGRARRGYVPEWPDVTGWLSRFTAVLSHRRHHFGSPGAAQAWFEWRVHGRSLPMLVAILLPFELGLLFVLRETPALVFYVLFGMLITPGFMAGFVAATVAASNPNRRDASGLSPFLATRPMTSGALIAAKLKVAVWSTAVAWALVLAAIALGLSLADRWPLVFERARQLRDAAGTPRAAAIGLLGLSGLILWTWKRLAHGLYIGLTGRAWLIKGSVFLTLSLVVVLGPLLQGIVSSKSAQAALWVNIPSIAAFLVALKMAAAAWIARRHCDARLLGDRALVIGAAIWCGAVLLLYAVLAWFADTPLVPRYVLILIAILAVPITRLAAAPLALSWNRHR